ncbi:MAG: aldo/keto reductase [Burkholderiaceae bacterium]|nr:aldo/keto reductase [Burkholderiaceae bacterium]
MRSDRRRWVLAAASMPLLAAGRAHAQAAAVVPQALPVERLAAERLAEGGDAQALRKPVPSTGELLPVIGLGTARRYDEASPVLRETLERFAGSGGRVVDTAPSYGRAEEVVGEIVEAAGLREKLFLATKVGAEGREAGRAQIEQSFRRLRTTRIDLVAVHNLRDVGTQLKTLRECKDEGRIRYLGITTSFHAQYPDFERVMRSERLDFIQVDYALDNRTAGERILPLALERGIATMVNLPFGRGRLFRAVQGRQLPEWAADIGCTSWAQLFLKYIVSHEAVVCAIPGTAKPEHARDNAGAARGPMPDAAERRRMERFVDAL